MQYYSKNKHSINLLFWLQDVVDFRCWKENLKVITLNEKCKELKDIEKGLSNKDASKKYGVPSNTIST